MTRAGVVATMTWVVLASFAAWLVAHARYTTDLSAFLPRSPTPTQRLLVEQLREGVASKLIIGAIEGADVKTRAQFSVALAARLRATGLFSAIENGEQVGLDHERALLFDHRYLLSDQVTPERFTSTGLRDAIQDALDLLAAPAGMLVKSLLPRDPTGEMENLVTGLAADRQTRTAEGVWVSRDAKRALLIARTRAVGSDTDGQERAIAAIQSAFAAVTNTAPITRDQGGPVTLGNGTRVALELSGPGVFSVASRATIKHEVMRLSILSTVLIMALLIVVYRSIPALALGLVPVASGALVGVAAVALGFGLVHGITLGFGVTLIGESVDYSIYLFIQSQRQAGPNENAGQAGKLLWPTIRLGVLTSVCGFASLLPSGFPGLAQLGLYSIAGLVAAALVTRFVLPAWLPAAFTVRDLTPLGIAAAGLLHRVRTPKTLLAIVPILAVVFLYEHRGVLWNRELSALSPISEEDQALDERLRSDVGAPDARYLVAVSGPDQESVLRSTERVDRRLEQLVEAGALGGFDSPARYLPSQTTQSARRASLPEPAQLRERLRQALVGLPIRIERLEPFLQDVESARLRPLLARDDLKGTSLATVIDSLLLGDGTGWTALLPIRAPVATGEIDISRVNSATSEAAPGQATVLDLKHEADTLYSTYLSEVVRLSLIGFAAIIVLLLFALRSLIRVVRVLAPLVIAVLTVAAALVLTGHSLTILHLIGMLLIVAVGSNYALFFDRRSNDAHPGAIPLTLASLMVANTATVLGFGVLAFSSVPVLSALGSTVAPGALLALVFSALLAQDLPASGGLAST